MAVKSTWKNWVGTQSSNGRVVEPTDLGTLKDAMRQAAEHGRMRASGAGHSWSPLVPVSEGDTIIVMNRLQRVIHLDVRN